MPPVEEMEDNAPPAPTTSWGSARLWFVSIAVMAVVAAWTFWQDDVAEQLMIHHDGRVYWSADVGHVVAKEYIQDHNLRTVVFLHDKDDDWMPKKTRHSIRKSGVKFFNLTFPADDSWHVSDSQYRRLERIFNDPVNYPVWIYCREDRSFGEKALVIYDVAQRQMSAKDSLQAMPRQVESWPLIVFGYTYEAWHAKRLARLKADSQDTASSKNDPPNHVR